MRSAVTAVLVEVGPGVLRGLAGIDADTAEVALDCIDDTVALVGDRPVDVAHLLREVFRPLAHAGPVLLVVPSWWPAGRIDRVRDAVHSLAGEVDVLARSQVLGAGSAARVLVEIAPELVFVTTATTTAVAAVPRVGGADEIASAVADAVAGAAEVLVDAPPGVEGADRLATEIRARVRAAGGAVAIADPELVLRRAAAGMAPTRECPTDARAMRPGRRAVAVLAGTATSVALLCAALVAEPADGVPSHGSMPITLLVEGRAAVNVPAAWRVERITTGPGSARVQVVSPSETDAAVLIVQSPVPRGQSLQVAADVIRAALDDQPGGVFSGFRPADRHAGRPAITYREDRGNRHIQWVVVLDGGLRIAIGCQSAADREPSVRPACDEAVRSAHAVY